jgi:hypothetical protein
LCGGSCGECTEFPHSFCNEETGQCDCEPLTCPIGVCGDVSDGCGGRVFCDRCCTGDVDFCCEDTLEACKVRCCEGMVTSGCADGRPGYWCSLGLPGYPCEVNEDCYIGLKCADNICSYCSSVPGDCCRNDYFCCTRAIDAGRCRELCCAGDVFAVSTSICPSGLSCRPSAP